MGSKRSKVNSEKSLIISELNDEKSLVISELNDEKNLIISELNDEKSLIISEFNEDMENLNDQVIGTDEVVEAAGVYEEMVKHWEDKAYHLKQTISGLNKKMRKLEDEIKEKDMVIKANNEVVAAGVYEEMVKHWEGKAYHLKQTISGLNKKMRNMENEIKEKDWVFKVNLELFEQEIETLKGQTFAKDQIIMNLNEKQSKVNDELQQKGSILGIYEDSSKYFKGKVGQLEEEIRDLKGEKSTAYQMIDRNNSEQSKTNGKQLIVSVLNDEKSLILTKLDENVQKPDFQVIEMHEAVEVVGAYEEMVKHWESKAYHLKQTISGLSKKMRQMENEKKEKDCVYKAKFEQFQQELAVLKGHIFSKDQIILNLDEKQSKINDELQEKDRILGIYVDSSKYFKGKAGQLEGEIRDLRGEKSAAYKMIDEIKSEQLKAIDGKNLIIRILNEEIGKLKNKVHEKDQVVVTYREEVKFFKEKVGQLEVEKEDLTGKASKMIVEMKCNQLAAQEIMEEMKCEKLKDHDEKDRILSELHAEIGKLRNQIHKKDLVVIMYEEKVKYFEEKEQQTVEIQGLNDQKQAANEMIEKLKREQLVAALMIKKIKSEQQAADRTIKKVEGEQLAAGQIADNMLSELSKANDEKTRRIGELYEDIGKLNNILLAKAELVEMYEEKLKSVGAKVVHLERGNEGLECQKLPDDEMIETVKSAQSKANHAIEELTCRNLESSKIMESDPRIVLCAMPKVPIAYNNSTKRTWSGLQRTGSPLAGSSSHSPQAEISDVDREKECKRFKGNSDTDDDESCLESAINNIVANVRCQRFCIQWVSVAEMQKELENNIEFCMNAVCVLYRHNISNPGKLGQFNAMRGNELAEYLINGDTQYRLRKLESEVKPDDLILCRKLAKEYIVKLFMIYNTGEDPLLKWK